MLDQLVARIPERGAALVLRGDPGIGKTALLAVASAAASSKGVSVLRTAGAQSEVGLAFAGLHQLLRPVLTWLDRLPGPQRDALSAAFGAIDIPAPDPFLIALAALNLLACAAGTVSLTSRLERAFAQQVSGLPEQTRDLLLLAAADERASAAELLAAASLLRGAEVPLDASAPAEEAGLA